MKSMKRIVAIALLALTLVSLCACGGDGGGGGDALKGTWIREDSFQGEITVTYDGKGGVKASWGVEGLKFDDKGTYTLDTETTGTLKLEGWSEEQTFTYAVTETTLTITDNYSALSGEFTKK